MPKTDPTPATELSNAEASEFLNHVYSQFYYQQTQSVDLVNNEVYLFGRDEHAAILESEPGIEYSLANQFIKNMNFLRYHALTESDVILIHMKSCGGYWREGMAIYDAIDTYTNPTVVLNWTHAQSMTSIIPLAANKIVMMPHSTFMIHRGYIGTWGTETQFKTEYEQSQVSQEQMFDIYIKRLRRNGTMKGKSNKTIRSFLDKQMKEKEEVYFTAEESVELGFADEIFDGDWERLKEL